MSGKTVDHGKLIKELRSALRGQVRDDALTLLAYASDSSIFRQVPIVVVYPLDAEDVSAAVKIGTRYDVPVTARGAGTSRAGQDLGQGMILDMSVHMNAILSVDEEQQSVLVEPGVVAADLEARLCEVGLFFPPDPSSSRICTIGGMVANNASGARTVKFGATRDYVQSLQVVLWDGSIVEIGPVQLQGDSVVGAGGGVGGGLSAFPAEGWQGLPGLLAPVAQLISTRQDVIRELYPWHLRKNSSGYNFKGIPFVGSGAGSGAGAELRQAPVIWNPATLFVGSEGTIGIITQIRLGLLKRPKESASLMVFLDSLPQVANTVQALIPYGPSKLELLDRELLVKASRAVQGLELFLEHKFNFLLMVEVWEEKRDEVLAILDFMERGVLGGVGKIRLMNREEERRIWTIRSKSVGYLNRMKGRQRAYPLLEDGSVGVGGLVTYVEGLGRIWKELGIGGLHYHGHAGDGNIHVNTMLDLSSALDVEKGRQLLKLGHELIGSLGGVMSGEHGDGRLRTPFLAEASGDLHGLVHVPLKKLLDPAGILNPEQKVSRGEMGLGAFGQLGQLEEDGGAGFGGSDGLATRGVLVNLRYGADYPVRMPAALANKEMERKSGTATQLVPCFKDDDVREVESCHGCGECRDYCPAFRGLGVETASSRNRADMLRELLSAAALGTGRELRFLPHIDCRLLSVHHKEFQAIMDLCVGCMGCLHDCPSGVEIPHIARAARSAALEGRLPTVQELLLHNLPALAELGARVPRLTNGLLSSAMVRKVLEVLFGLERRAVLPQLASVGLDVSAPSCGTVAMMAAPARVSNPALAACRCGSDGEASCTYDSSKEDSGRDVELVRAHPEETMAIDGVVFFPGCQGRLLSGGGGVAAVSALTRAIAPLPVAVAQVPCCGMPAWNQGLNPHKPARKVLRELERYVSRNMVAVFGCPSCRYMVVNNYRDLLGEDWVRFLDGRHFDIHQFLSMTGEGVLRLPERPVAVASGGGVGGGVGEGSQVVGASIGSAGGFELSKLIRSLIAQSGGNDDGRVRVAHHVPCHGRGMGVAEAVADTVGRLPWVQFVELPRGCCGGGGAGGVLGLRRDGYDSAVAMGQNRIGALEKMGGADLLVSSCMTCRAQLATMTGLPVYHPLDLLQVGYSCGNMGDTSK